MAYKDKEELPEVKRVKTDPENLHISRDAFVAKRRKQKEYDAQMAIASQKIKAELDSKTQEVESNEIQTVATVVKNKGGRKPRVKVEQTVQQ